MQLRGSQVSPLTKAAPFELPTAEHFHPIIDLMHCRIQIGANRILARCRDSRRGSRHSGWQPKPGRLRSCRQRCERRIRREWCRERRRRRSTCQDMSKSVGLRAASLREEVRSTSLAKTTGANQACQRFLLSNALKEQRFEQVTYLRHAQNVGRAIAIPGSWLPPHSLQPDFGLFLAVGLARQCRRFARERNRILQTLSEVICDGDSRKIPHRRGNP